MGTASSTPPAAEPPSSTPPAAEPPSSTGRARACRITPRRAIVVVVPATAPHPPAWPAAALDCLASLGDLVWPATCVGCGSPGASWCPSCADLLARLARAGPRRSADAVPPLWAAAPYAGPVRHAVVAFKDGDRRDAAPVLAPLLASAIRGALFAATAGPPPAVILVVPAPSSPRARRRRGDLPLHVLGRAALAALGDARLRWAPALHHTRAVADQVGLHRSQRAANLAGAVGVRRRFHAVLPGAACLLVDDVVTTGATMRECARALGEAGARVLGAGVLAATPSVGSGRGPGVSSPPRP